MMLAHKPAFVRTGPLDWASFESGDDAEHTVIRVRLPSGNYQHILSIDWYNYLNREEAEQLAEWIVFHLKDQRMITDSDLDLVASVLAGVPHSLAPPDKEPSLRMVAAAAHSLALFRPWPPLADTPHSPRMCPWAVLRSEEGPAIIAAAREMLIAAERWRE